MKGETVHGEHKELKEGLCGESPKLSSYDMMATNEWDLRKANRLGII